APPEGRSLVAPLDDDANRFDGPYVSFIYPKTQQKPAYLTVRLDQSTTSCGDALRQGLWVLYGSPGSAGFPTFTPMEVEAHIAKYVERALDTRTNRRRESFTPEPNLVELWKDPTTNKVPLKVGPASRICRVSPALGPQASVNNVTLGADHITWAQKAEYCRTRRA
ncbi:hypothetical protein FOZ62_009421, partial [Perkinsus olseni]